MERNIRLLALFNFFTDFKLHSAVLIIYFSRVTGSFGLAMSLFSVVMVSSAVFEIPTGIFSDLIGRKRTIVLGALSATISAVCYALGFSYASLLIGALFEGVSRAWYSGNNEALLYESLPANGNKETFAYYLGKTSAMFQLALMIGAVVGSIIANWSFPLIMWLSVLPQVVCLIISFFFIEPPRITKGKSNIFFHLNISITHIWHNKKLRLLSLQEVLRYGIGESSFHFNAAFIQTLWPIWAIGLSRLMTFSGAFVSYWYSNKIIKKIGEYNVIIFANMFTRIINLIAYGLPTVISPVLMGTTSLTYGASMVSNNSLMQKEFTHEQRATLASITSLFGNLFYGVFSIALGFYADSFGPAQALIAVQLLMFCVLYIQWKLKTFSLEKK